MALPDEERLRLADRLYDSAESSLDPETEAYLRMLDARAAAERGESRTYTWDEVRKMVLPQE